MGQDISPIGDHKLNTSDVHLLAYDIANRLNANVDYCYFGYHEYFELLDTQGIDDIVLLGKVIKDEKLSTIRLIEDDYQLKQLHVKYGDKVFYMPEFWGCWFGEPPSDKHILQMKKSILYPEYQLDFKDGNGSISIYKELFTNDIPYFGRWEQFCRFFTQRQYIFGKHMHQLMEFRKELKFFLQTFGGAVQYYVSDQEPVLEGIGEGNEADLSWTEFEAFIKFKTSELMLNIPLFLNDTSYRKEFLSKKKFPLSFFDDFSDLP